MSPPVWITVPLPVIPGYQLHLSHWKDVINRDDLISMVKSGSLGDVALLNADMIMHSDQVGAAACQALAHKSAEKMVTRTLHTELVHCLSPGKSISDSLRMLGVGSATDRLVVALLSDSSCDQLVDHLTRVIQGRLASAQEIEGLVCTDKLVDYYKITELERTKCSLLDAIISRIASKDVYK